MEQREIKMQNVEDVVIYNSVFDLASGVAFNEINKADWDLISAELCSPLLDKNKKEIHEGDIIKSSNGRVWQVKYGEYKFIDNAYPVIGFYMEGEGTVFPMWNEEDETEDEIIGNIYEHPNLIE